jgi:aspartate/methionine/tyrosine aminotransferase
MKLKPFKLERYFAEYEFSVKFLLSSSDCDGLSQRDLLALADPETAKLWHELTLGYTESLGHPLLRSEIAGMYNNLTAAECLVTVPEEGIFLALNSMLRPGDHVICTYPGYQSLYEVAQGLGCTVTHWCADEAQNWRFDPAHLEQAFRPNTKLIVVNFPHNPTGALPSQADFARIITLARTSGAYLFSDEMYRWLEHSPTDRLPAACEVYDRAVSLSGMSKTFGMAGVRIGWVATHDADLLAAMANLKDYTTICSSAPSEILSLIGLRSRHQIVDRHLARIDRNLRLINALFGEFPDHLSWHQPRAGTVGFPRLLRAAGALEFCQDLLRSHDVMMLPATVYDYGNQHVRIGFGRENLPQALDRLADFLRTR